MMGYDFTKFSHPRLLHVAFLALHEFMKANEGRRPKCWNVKDAENYMVIATKLAQSFIDDFDK